MRVRRTLFWVLLVLVVLTGAVGIAAYCAVGTFAVAIPESLKGDDPGTLVSVERTGKYPGFVAQYILNSVDLPDPIDVKYGITLYRVQYRTTNYDGSVVVASGLVALPNGSALNSVVVYHHGTNAQRRTAPSQPGLGEGVLIAAATAGMGHVLVAPDYIGLGESRTIHPYMHAKTMASTSIDFLHAARALVEHLRGKWPGSLYLMGFSQGGHATFAVQRDLEKLHDPRFEVKASAPIAGPFHVREVSFPQALTGETKSHAFYLAYITNSYAHIYDRPLKSILTAPYVEMVPVLFDGDHTTEEISAALPDDPRKLFNPEFLAAYDKGKSHWFLDALAENNVDAWTPVAPVRIYYGDDDVDVLPEEARRAEVAMKRRGADVTAISVGACKHDTSALRAIPQAIRWFTDLANKKPAG
jgi:pimeloyl-ACP methyl ester carboxylesterase